LRKINNDGPQHRRNTKIHTTKLYLPSNGSANAAEISVEIPSGTGDISLSIHRAGSSNNILGPNGWQSADYWFNGTPSDVSDDSVAWFSLPPELVQHITYSNYSVFCRRIGNSLTNRTVLTGGALVSRPSLFSSTKGSIELPPLPTGFSQAAIGTIAAVEKPDITLDEHPLVFEEKPSLNENNARFQSLDSHEISAEQSKEAPPPQTALKETHPISKEAIATPPEASSIAKFDVPITRAATSNIPQKPFPKSNLPVALGFLILVLLSIALYFANFRTASPNNDGTNVKTIVEPNIPATPPTSPTQNGNRPVIENAKDVAKTVTPSEPDKKATKPSVTESNPPLKNKQSNSPSEPAKSVPAPAPAPAPTPEKTTEKAQPPASNIPDLNRMVNDALKR